MSTQPVNASAVSPSSAESRSTRPNKESPGKSDLVLRALKRKSGVSVDDLCNLTGWQAHSVRGFLSGTVRKKMGLEVVRQQDAKGVTRYSISKPGASS